MRKARRPKKPPLINAVNIIQWTLYYPAILDLDELEMPADLQRLSPPPWKPIAAAICSRPWPNIPPTASPPPKPNGFIAPPCFWRWARWIKPRLCCATRPSEPRPAALADALQEMIASVKGQPFTRTAPRTLATEWMAGSYAAQSRRDLAQSLNMAQSAAAKSPSFGFAQERLAEMEFSFGHTEPALAALKESLALSPRNAQALALKGFALSAQNKIAQAGLYFDQAIAADGSLANGWLGRGLVRIRNGHVNGGRQDLETAAALEPNRAFLRSYLGKAWSLDQPFQYPLEHPSGHQ